MRMSSFIVCLALLVGSAAFLRGTEQPRALLSWLVVSVPLGLFLYSSTNPSGVAVASVGATFAATYAALVPPQRRAGWGATALACFAIVVGCQTRPDALYFCVIAVLAAALASETWRRDRRRHSTLVGLPIIATLALMTLLRDVGPEGAVTAGATTAGPTILYNSVRVPLLYLGDFATNLGWLDTHMPKPVWGSIALAIIGVLLLGLREMTVGRWVALAMLVSACFAVPLVMLDQVGAGVGNEVQPRYLLPLVLTLAGVLAVRPGNAEARPLRPAWLAVAGLATVSNSLAIHTTLRRYVTGTDVSGWNLDVNSEWWWDIPISPMGVWVLGSVAFAILAFWLVARLEPSAGSAHVRGVQTHLATIP